MTALPNNWRKLPTAKLMDWVDQNGDHDDYDDVWNEIDERDRQAAANRGEMNGLPPEYDMP